MNNHVNEKLHLGIIMDGNGRWAKERTLSRIEGHRQGAKTAQNLVNHIKDLGIGHLTLFGFSTENWRRPKEEVNALMALFEQTFKDFNLQFPDNNIRFHFVGDKTGLPLSLTETIENTENRTRLFDGMHLYLALNYGGRSDILHATKRIAQDFKNNIIELDDINETLFSSYLQSNESPHLDMILRTGGEIRISNFHLWQAAYSELFFINTLWPDVTIEDIKNIINAYEKRERRYGDTL